MIHDVLLPLSETVAHLAETLALAVGGLWTYRRFIRQRDDHARLDLTADLEFVGTQAGQHLVVVHLVVVNAGTVRHRFSDLCFDLRTIEADTPLKAGDAHVLGQVSFPTVIHRNQRIFPSSWVWSFIEPGATNRYRYATSIPVGASFALLRAWLVLPGDDEFVAAWTVKAIPVVPRRVS